MIKKILHIALMAMCFATVAQHRTDTISTVQAIKNSVTKQIDRFLIKDKVPSSKRSRGEYQKKIIRRIHIKVFSPFGYDEKDTLKTPNYWERIGNKFHINTRVGQIANFLQFQENTPLDTTLIESSENLLQRQPYIRRVDITPKYVESSKDSVDVYVGVLDSWSIGASFSVNSSGGSFSIKDYNFLGLGHRWFSSVEKDRRWGYSQAYEIYNIGKSFVSLGANIKVDPEGNRLKTLYITRPFYNNVIKWTAGALYINRTYYDEISNSSKNGVTKNEIQQQFIDLWVGYLFPFEQSDWKATVSARYLRTDFPSDLHIDYDGYYTDENLMLFSLGLRKVNYSRGHYIFRSGDKELITQGYDISLTLGLQDNLGEMNPYFGVGFSRSKFTDNQYISVALQYGNYFLSDSDIQPVIRIHSTYISPSFEVKNWKFRQFIRWSSVMGWNRKNYQKDRVTINGSQGIYGFRSPHVYGLHKHVLNFQIRTYSPYQWLGFRLNPFILGDIAGICHKDNPFVISEVYTKLGVGLILKNDYFIFSNIHLSLSVFPKIPGRGNNIIYFSDRKTDSFFIENYQYLRPSVVGYW